MVEPTTAGSEADVVALSLILDGLPEPLDYAGVDASEIAGIATALEGTQPGEEKFISFRDEDREENLINARTIIVMGSIPYAEDSEEDETD
jgi:hypothetical protein